MTERDMATPERMRERWRVLREKHAQSQAIFGIAMAGVAGLFIIGIVAAFLYAANTASPPAEMRAEAPQSAPQQPSAQ